MGKLNSSFYPSSGLHKRKEKMFISYWPKLVALLHKKFLVPPKKPSSTLKRRDTFTSSYS
jgi:hypothetical protein